MASLRECVVKIMMVSLGIVVLMMSLVIVVIVVVIIMSFMMMIMRFVGGYGRFDEMASDDEVSPSKSQRERERC